MTRRDVILAVALAVAAALFTAGVAVEFGRGPALMVAAVLLAAWAWLLFTGDESEDTE